MGPLRDLPQDPFRDPPLDPFRDLPLDPVVYSTLFLLLADG